MVYQTLEPGEQITWMAQPEPPFIFRDRAWAFFLLGLCLALISAGIIVGGITSCFSSFSWASPVGSAFTVLFGIVKFALGYIVLWGPITVIAYLGLTAPRWARKTLQTKVQNTLYVITDRRVVVVNGGVADEVQDCWSITPTDVILSIEDAWYYWNPNRRPLPVLNSYPPEMLNRIQPEDRKHVYFHYEKLLIDNDERMYKTGFRYTPDIETAVTRLHELASQSQPAPPRISAVNPPR